MRPIGRVPKSREEAQRNVNAFKDIKNKIVDKVSDVMSYPARRKAQKAILQDTENLKDIKLVNQAGSNTEPIPNDYRSELFRARANVSNLKTQQMQALRKQNK